MTDKERYKAEQAKKGLVVVLHKGKRVKIAFGDRWEKHTRHKFSAYFEDPDTGRLDIATFRGRDIVEGKYQDIYFPPSVHVGSFGPSGAVAKGIRTGKAFRR